MEMDREKRELMGSLNLPKVNQVGIVVKNIDKAISLFSELYGINPWFHIIESGTPPVFYKENRIEQSIKIAVAFSGQIQFEFIQPCDSNENIYNNHLEKHGEGIHHLGFFVSNLKKRVLKANSLDIKVIQQGIIINKGGSVTNYAYLDTLDKCGIMMEFIDSRIAGIPYKMSPLFMNIGRITGGTRIKK